MSIWFLHLHQNLKQICLKRKVKEWEQELARQTVLRNISQSFLSAFGFFSYTYLKYTVLLNKLWRHRQIVLKVEILSKILSKYKKLSRSIYFLNWPIEHWLCQVWRISYFWKLILYLTNIKHEKGISNPPSLALIILRKGEN